MPKKPTKKTTIPKTTMAEHHRHMRKRSGQLDFSFIDHLIIFSGPLIPLATAIQGYNVWISGKSEGLSLTTWLLLTFSSITLAIYAVYHRSKPLMLVYLPLVIANIVVVAGILLHS